MKKMSLVVSLLIAFSLILLVILTPGCELAPSDPGPAPTPVPNTSGWTKMTINTSKDLVCVWGNGVNKVYTASADGDIWFFNGSTWSYYYHITPISGSVLTANCIWVSSDNYVFVGSTEQCGVDQNGKVRWYNGTTWNDKNLTDGVLKIWGLDHNNVYVTEKGGNIVHFDGSDWTYMNSGVTQPLYSIFGLDADSIYAGGGETSGVVIRYVPGSPGSWTAMTINPSTPAVTNPVFKTIWGYSGTPDSWWGGGPDFSGTSNDGSSWNVKQFSNLLLNGIWGKTDGSLIFGVGSYSSTGAPPIQHNIFRYNKTTSSWDFQDGNPPANDKTLYAIWGTDTDFFAVGEDGTILRYH
ncbi:MAG: hypothetical protein K6U80_13450 [Firmicutes bacterium]|nr:hypothetical protein [Bacillota bacterium]